MQEQIYLSTKVKYSRLRGYLRSVSLVVKIPRFSYLSINTVVLNVIPDQLEINIDLSHNI